MSESTPPAPERAPAPGRSPESPPETSPEIAGREDVEGLRRSAALQAARIARRIEAFEQHYAELIGRDSTPDAAKIRRCRLLLDQVVAALDRIPTLEKRVGDSPTAATRRHSSVSMTPMTTDLLREAVAFLHANLRGEFQFDEHLRPVKIVIAPDGRLVGPVMVAMLEAAETVLFLPQADDDAMQVLVTLEQITEAGDGGALADRWRIHHGEPEDVNWAIFSIDAVRFRDSVIDGTVMLRANLLTDHEARLCRLMNDGHRDRLRELCLEAAGIVVEDPVMVGIDPDGMNVRGRFDVIRIPFDPPVANVEEAERRLLAHDNDA